MKLRGLALLGLLLAVTSALAGDWRQDRAARDCATQFDSMIVPG
jgi:hypothetical protein